MNYLRLSVFVLLFSLLISCSKTQDTPGVLHGKRVMILGNSITQNGAYVTYLEYYLRKYYPEQKLDIISIGLSSETVNGASEEGHPFPRPCVHSRVDSALFIIKPDLVLACYGMNDGLFSSFDKSGFEAYKKGIYKLDEKVKGAGAQLILLTPTLFDPDPIKERISMDGEAHAYKTPYYKYNEVLDGYADWLLSLQEEGFKVIDLHYFLSPILSEAKAMQEDSTFIPDGVHPNRAGHFLMAKKVLKDLYPDVEVGNPYPTIKELKQDSLFMLVEKRRKLRSNGWLKYIGYIRKDTVKTNDIVPTRKKVRELDAKIYQLQNPNQ